MSPPDRFDLTSSELADAFWLARHMKEPVVASEPDPVDEPERVPPPVARSDPPPHPASPDPVSRRGERRGFVRTAAGEQLARQMSTSVAARLPLPHARAIGRELRPFKQLARSNTEVEFDEEATAVRVAEDGQWLPAFRRAKVHPYELVLVVDTAALDIWRRDVDAFRTLVENLGAFRNVRSYFLDCGEEHAEHLVMRSGSQDGPTHRVEELLDPSGRRIILVLTDGVGRSWHTGAVGKVIGQWGRSTPVSVINMLPQELWHWTGISVVRARLRVSDTGGGNTRFQHELSDTADERPSSAAIPVPVMELDATWLGRWAALLTGYDSGWSLAAVFFADPDVKLGSVRPGPPLAQDMAPAERLRRFRTIASEAAFRLAGLLAAAPLSVAVMTTVREAFLPGSRMSHLAEVMLGGLLRRPRKDESARGIDYVFHDRLREELLATSSRSDTARVLRIVAEKLGPEVVEMQNMKIALDDPDVEIPEVSQSNLPYLRLQHIIMRALSGPYARRARRIGKFIGADPASGLDLWSGNMRTMPVSNEPGVADISTDEGEEVNVSVQQPTQIAPQRQMGDPPPVWSAPPRNINFTGRHELLDHLHSRLISAEASATAVLPEALYGLGGIGKSQVAVEYAYRHMDDYDLVWWVPSEDSAHIRSAFVELSSRLGISDTGAVNTLVEAVREALRLGQPYRRWLLVFDNADSPEQVRPFFPNGGTGHILVTSRNSHWSRVAQTVEVTLFSRVESQQLLQEHNRGLTDADAVRIAEVLGDLPLAIEQAASWLAETRMDASDYLELLEEKRAELLAEGLPLDYHVPVAAAWNVSLDRLAEESPAALQLLQVCAFFAPEPINRALLSEVQHIPVPDELAAALRDPLLLGNAIRQVNRYSLAQIDQRSRTILLHRLVQGALVDRMTAQERTQMRHAAHVLLAMDDPREPGNSLRWPKFLELLPHVRASEMWECDDPEVRRTAVHHAVFLSAWGDDASCLEFSRQLADYWAQHLGVDNAHTLLAAKQVGIALRSMGRYTEALAVDEETYALSERAGGEEAEHTLVMANMVAQDLRALGDFTKAWELSDGAYQTACRTVGLDNLVTLAMADNLSIALRLMGRFTEARDLDQDTWQRRSQILGENHRFTLATLNDLCLDIRECGDYLAARDRLEVVVSRYRDLIGEDHPDTLRALQNLAVTMRKTGDHAGGRTLSEEVLRRYVTRYGEGHPGSLAASMSLSVDLRQTGDLHAALARGAKALNDYTATLGEDHPYVLAGRTNLAVTLRSAGDLDRATELNLSAFTKLSAALGDEHPFVLLCATNRASDLAAAGEFHAAHELDLLVLGRSRRSLGEDHPSTLAVQANLALDLRALGRVIEGETLHADAISRFRRVLGDRHPATIAAAGSVRADCDIELLPTD